MNFCPVVPLDLGSPYATLLDSKSPSETLRKAIDWNDFLACNNPGVTLTGTVWSIHPDDDDTMLSLAQPSLDDGLSAVNVVGGTVNQSYRLVCTATLDDGQSIMATIQIGVRDVYKQALAA